MISLLFDIFIDLSLLIKFCMLLLLPFLFCVMEESRLRNSSYYTEWDLESFLLSCLLSCLGGRVFNFGNEIEHLKSFREVNLVFLVSVVCTEVYTLNLIFKF